ncbi:TEA domain-containing protein [Mycena venus]|uniref:TEA domain-containing protein n=1 Tax=Mycena venus TaxID=2733690 RepID=A0A8H6X4G4_9AGAR|nr:TEA domain-containing protein [Mycena venus]
MYRWDERENTPSTLGSSTSCWKPSKLSSDLLLSPSNKNSWPKPTLPNEDIEDSVLQSVLRVRKSWKTSRDGQTVWPFDLEAALLEGLERYQPDNSRGTRMLQRFPRRNRFISDYIFDKTGKRRLPTQVGSRLQQLRDSGLGSTQLLQLLKPACSASSMSTDRALSSPISPIGEGPSPTTMSVRNAVIYVDILPGASVNQGHIENTPSPWADVGDGIHVSENPRRIESINPIVSFIAPSPVVGHSWFTVYSDGFMIHTETVVLLQVYQAHQPSGLLYSSQLIPKYWKVIVESPDPTRFTIFQEVLRTENSSILFSATYIFSYSKDHKNLCS